MNQINLSKHEICKFLIIYHNLHKRVSCEQIVPQLFARLGCIQYDPLNVCGRNADLVLQSRVLDYRPETLERLLYDERRLLDGWDKMMSIYPLSDWPAFARMREYRDRASKNTLAWRKSLHVLEKTDAVSEHLRINGAAKAAAIDLGRLDPGAWGHRRESSAVLDYLFHTGQVLVARKAGTQKLYDLAEHLLPAKIFKAKDPFKSDREYHRWYLLRRIASVGILWNRNSVLWQDIGEALRDTRYRKTLLDELCEEKTLCCLSVGASAEPFYIKRQETSLLQSSQTLELEESMRLIAALDNLIWDRDMTEEIFDFNYRWEVYTPAAKRQFGYYVLPLLYKGRFVGRIEPLADRKNKTLVIKNIWKEPSVRWTKKMSAALHNELSCFAAFLGCDCVGKTPAIN